MPLKGEAKRLWQRNHNRTMRYGNWRQIYYNAGGACEGILESGERCGAIDRLEIHEETDGISVIYWKLVCIDCHLKGEHKDANTDWIHRRYASKLAEDINAEILRYGGLENWKKAFFIKEDEKNGK